MPHKFIGSSLTYQDGEGRRRLSRGAVDDFPLELVKRYPTRFVPAGETKPLKAAAQTTAGPKPSDGVTLDPNDTGSGEVRRRYRRKK